MIIRRGSKRADLLIASDHNENLLGLGGNDVIRGGAGDDVLRGGQGRDKLFGGDGSDLVYGGSGADTIFGGVGFNFLSGGTGNDHFRGREGVNVFVGGSGRDTVSYEDLEGGWGVRIVGASGSESDANGDTFRSIEVIIGTNFSDSFADVVGDVYAVDGDDSLWGIIGTADGGAGNDFMSTHGSLGGVLRGGRGDDHLQDGGMGVTHFWLDADGGIDSIYYFDQGADRIRIDGGEFGIGGVLDGNEFTQGAYSGNGPQFRVDSGILAFDFDGAASMFEEVVLAYVYFDPGWVGMLQVADFEII